MMQQEDLQARRAALFAELQDCERRIAQAGAAALAGDSWQPDWITFQQALDELRLSAKTLRRYLVQYGLGYNRGRWMIDLNRIRAWREQKPYPRLEPS